MQSQRKNVKSNYVRKDFNKKEAEFENIKTPKPLKTANVKNTFYLFNPIDIFKKYQENLFIYKHSEQQPCLS